ncbi:aspartate-glutamate racemase family [Fagus crenata]
MVSPKKWACIISFIASWTYFLVIIYQIPLFRIPCRTGICRTPIQVTCSQLIASELFPAVVVKALLYPGAIANAYFKNKTVPSYNNLLKLYKLTNIKAAPATSDLQRIEVLAGSYLSIAGAILGLVKPRRMSLFGTLLILWGLVREAIMRKFADKYLMEAIYINPTMLIAVVSAFLSIRKDVRKIVRSYNGKRNAKYSCSHLKAKLE